MRPALPGPKRAPRPAPPPSRSPPKAPRLAVLPGGAGSRFSLLWVLLLSLLAGLAYEFWPQLRQTAVQTVADIEQRRQQARQIQDAPNVAAQARPEAAPAYGEMPAPPPSSPPSPARAAVEPLAEALQALALGPLREIAGLSSEAMQLGLGPSGQLLFTSKYAVLRLDPAEPLSRRTLFTPGLYLQQFPDDRPQAMASALALPGERYLLGGWHGELLLWDDGRLSRLSGREQRPRGRIADLQRHGDAVLLAGDGLWRWQPGQPELEELPLPGTPRVRALGQRPERLLLAVDGGRVLEWTAAHGAQAWLRLPPDAGSVEAIRPADDGGWWLAGTRGLYHASADGQRLETVLDGVWTTSLVEQDGELWVGSWKQGLLLRREGRWYRLGAGLGGLAEDSVSDLAIDSEDQLWLALYGGGGWQAPRPVLRAELLRRPWTPVPDSP